MIKDDIYRKTQNLNITYNKLNTLSYKQTKSIFMFITLNFNIYITALCYDGNFSFQCYQKQTFTNVLQNRCSYKFSKISRKTFPSESLFNKVAGSQTSMQEFSKEVFKRVHTACMFPIRHVFQNIETFSLD